MKRLVSCSALLALLIGTVGQASAVIISWDGTGTSGVDPFGHAWDTDNDQDNGDGSWGLPGLQEGNLNWNGPDWITDFHITFSGLPVGVLIDPTPLPVGPFGIGESTRFSNVTDGVLWNREIVGNTVWFFANDLINDRLDPVEVFFVNVAFDGPIDLSTLSFEAEYSMIPEPSTWLLLSITILSIIGMGYRQRKKAA